ncbi:isoprenyl transferase [Priestia filamentosa]|uniref:Isoprenyl transferase n=2 Tax=Priestia filamentosa TaxID=1402861 RepID=A0A1X7D759_9BACI|nr:isoprenyl transferase [Priestia filamentosa]AKO93813.1 isoprenyl transferase [Priestia filamentosa]MDT3764050.1 isoprenyl transferase [Priestia filamentosa]OXS71475.1 isoprenyl transferase [Priestia filamentosa]WCM14687.1 isoprenyl transferase [Priestia filamentosa]WRU94449.1 isoprenyl transferase [Priestia filamentosa]
MIKKFQQLLKEQKSNTGTYEQRKKQVMKGSIPEHVAIIMDGNGRWAQKRAMPRIMGHHEGMKVVRKITRAANELNVKVLTLYAFSTENWKRPKMEVEFLMKLPEEFLSTFLPELIEENVQVRVMGNKERLPAHTLNAVNNAIERTKENTGLILNFALNYGSRDELVYAVNKLMEEADPNKAVTEADIQKHLMSGDLKDPDLLIRTSGEIRLSNFMLWQLAYAEFWFTDVLWPDFRGEHFLSALEDYQNRGRRFGGVKDVDKK